MSCPVDRDINRSLSSQSLSLQLQLPLAHIFLTTVAPAQPKALSEGFPKPEWGWMSLSGSFSKDKKQFLASLSFSLLHFQRLLWNPTSRDKKKQKSKQILPSQVVTQMGLYQQGRQPALPRPPVTISSKATSTRLLNLSRDRDSTTVLGSPF